MPVNKPVGPQAASLKYDVLSALAIFGLSLDKHRQRQVLRLMALITTRYNWQRNELSMGQSEIATLWSVDVRTVKREMARLRALGWLVEKRSAARGRVTVHALDLDRLLEATRPVWTRIGLDFIARIRVESEPAPDGSGNVVPFRAGPSPEAISTLWDEVRTRLYVLDPTQFAVWLDRLVETGCEDGTLYLSAPSRFHASYVTTHLAGRIADALRRANPAMHDVVVRADG